MALLRTPTCNGTGRTRTPPLNGMTDQKTPIRDRRNNSSPRIRTTDGTTSRDRPVISGEKSPRVLLSLRKMRRRRIINCGIITSRRRIRGKG